MPPAPEILHRIRQIRALEIGQQIEAQDLSRSSGNVRISREIAVDLKRIQYRSQNNLHSAEGAELTVDRIHRNRDPVRDQKLLAESPENQEAAVPDTLDITHILPRKLPNLSQQITAPLDRSLHQLGEESLKQGKPQQIFLCFRPALPYVCQITDGLKGVKGNSHRKQQPQTVVFEKA